MPMKGFFGDSDGKESATLQETQVKPWVKKIPWKRGWLPTPVFMPGVFPGQRSLMVGYSHGLQRDRHKTTDRLTHTDIHTETHMTIKPERNIVL